MLRTTARRPRSQLLEFAGITRSMSVRQGCHQLSSRDGLLDLLDGVTSEIFGNFPTQDF